HAVGVGNDDPLVRVIVIGGTTQLRRALGDLDDPRQRAVLTTDIAHHPDVITGHDGVSSQDARLYGGDDARVEGDRVPSAVGAGGDAVGRVLGARSDLRARAAATTGPLKRGVLVVFHGRVNSSQAGANPG